MGDRSIIQYFDSMPRNVEIGEIVVDGCVDLEGNIKIRKMLRNPNTFYIVRIMIIVLLAKPRSFLLSIPLLDSGVGSKLCGLVVVSI